MKVLICGSREWSDTLIMETVIAGLGQRTLPDDPITIIHGDARGADRMAGKIAERCGYRVKRYPAKWPPHGSPKSAYAKAGHERNQKMLDQGRPSLVIAFKDDFDLARGTGGTEDMVSRANRAGIPAYVVGRP